MRRYGTLKYGATQYGLGTVDVSYADNVVYNNKYQFKILEKVTYSDNIPFNNQFHPEHLRLVYYRDLVQFEDDIRLKYVRASYEATVNFSETFRKPEVIRVVKLLSSVTFSESLRIIPIKNVGSVIDITFSEYIWARQNWQPLSNPEDEIWVPRGSETDIWVPRVSPTDLWIPREQNNG